MRSFLIIFLYLGVVFSQSISAIEENKEYLMPISQILGFNGLIATVNRYVRDVDYAKISFKSIGYNVSNSWVWDDDNFAVNQIGHPYQGNFYYLFAKKSGHNYYESTAFTAFGSTQWEYFMETERPAINDLITTTLGGAMLGEINDRLSKEIIDNSSTGFIRVLRETGAFAINPIKGLNRLVNGNMFKIRSHNNIAKKNNLKLEISIEGRMSRILNDENLKDSLSSVPMAKSNIQMIYGDPFSVKKPFDHFSLDVGLSFEQNLVANVLAKGVLWQKNIRSEPKFHNVLGVTQNFDYITSHTYKLSANSIGLEFMGRRSFSTGWHFAHTSQIGVIVLGGASTDYYVQVERDYNLGPGVAIKLGIAFYKENVGKVSFKIDRFFVRTLSGAEGMENVGLGTFEIQKNIYKRFGIATSFVFYDREGSYIAYPDVKVFNYEFRGMLTYNFY